MADRFAAFNDRELDRIWEALSAFDAGRRPKIEEEVTALFKEAAEAREARSRKETT